MPRSTKHKSGEGGAGQTSISRKRSVSIPIVAVVALFSIFLLSGCGLEVLPYIAGPVENSVTGGIDGVFTFRHNANLNDVDEFLGYEIYYKLYDNSGGSAAYSADRAAIVADPELPGTSRLIGRGYRRMRSYSSIPNISIPLALPPPAIPVELANRGTEFTISVKFGQDAADEEAARAEWNGKTVYLGRNIEQSNDNQSFFPVEETRYLASDADVGTDLAGTVASAISGRDLYIGLFAVGYGVDGQTFQEIYSVPVPLIYMTIQQQAGSSPITN